MNEAARAQSLDIIQQYTAFAEKRELYKQMFAETKLMRNLLEKSG
jgi:hypothetical protein